MVKKITPADAHRQGVLAYSDDADLNENPFDKKVEADQYREWRAGWQSAADMDPLSPENLKGEGDPFAIDDHDDDEED